MSDINNSADDLTAYLIAEFRCAARRAKFAADDFVCPPCFTNWELKGSQTRRAEPRAANKSVVSFSHLVGACEKRRRGRPRLYENSEIAKTRRMIFL